MGGCWEAAKRPGPRSRAEAGGPRRSPGRRGCGARLRRGGGAGGGSVADCRGLRGRACAGPWHGSSEPCHGFAFRRLSVTVSGRQRAHEPRSDHGVVRPNHGVVRSNHCMVRPNHGTVRSNRGVASLPGRAIWDGGGVLAGCADKGAAAAAAGARRRVPPPACWRCGARDAARVPSTHGSSEAAPLLPLRVGEAELETRPASPTRRRRWETEPSPITESIEGIGLIIAGQQSRVNNHEQIITSK